MTAARTALPPDPAGAAHAGLLLARYLGHPADGTAPHQAARDRLTRAARDALAGLARSGVYRRAFERWRGGLPAGAVSRMFRTDPRMVIGLGGHTVLETGLTLHHTYGTPVLPGTAPKGLAAHYCHAEWGADPRFRGGRDPGDAFRVLFGTQAEGGLVRFPDAWLDPDGLTAALCDDVMTPHHTAYYADQPAGSPPADSDDPVPVTFLSISGRFLVAVSATPDPRLGGDAGVRWAGLALDLLSRALGEWGVGGKTGSGYGRLVAAPE